MDKNIDEDNIIEDEYEIINEEEPEDDQEINYPDYNTAYNDNYEKAGQIQNELGSQALQKMGVPEPLAKIAAKTNGGPLSPNNSLANRITKKKGQELIAKGLDKFQNNSNNSNSKQGQLNKFNQNFNHLNDYRNRGEDNSQAEGAPENSGDNQNKQGFASKTAKNLGSKYLKSKGIPDGLADGIAEKIVEQNKKKLMIYIASAIIPIVLFIIIFSALGSDTSAGETETAQSEEMTDYLYGSGNTDKLYKKLMDLGLCETNDECANTQAAAFYIKLRDVISTYNDTTKKIAANFIIELTRYNRSNDTDQYQKGRYDTLEEIDYLASIILSRGSLSIDSLKNFKEEIIKDGGYFETYRQDILEEGIDNTGLKSEIFDSVLNSVSNIIAGIKMSGSTTNYCGGDINVVEFNSMTHEQYISAMGPLAQADYSNTGVLASVTLAQSILESNWGKSGLTQKAKNLFGMKVGAKFDTGGWDGQSKLVLSTKEEDRNGNIYTTDAEWRVYDTVGASIADHSALLVSGRPYRDKVITKSTYEEQIKAIKQAGYATDSQYVSKIVKVIEQYGLDKWDVKINSINSSVCGGNLGGNWNIRTISPSMGDVAFNYLKKQNVGQCVWYAQGRAIEIILELIQKGNISQEIGNEAINRLGSIMANAEAWYRNSKGLFKGSSNYKDVKAGSIIVWSGGSNMCTPQCGHVAVVESVTENEIIVTDGWADGGSSCPNTWDCIRFRSKTMTIDEFYNWVPTEGVTGKQNGKKFEGYIYFLELES